MSNLIPLPFILADYYNYFFVFFQFFKNGEWWTWIDYKRFHKLINAYTESNGKATFTAEDYMAKTPHWAVFGASEQGFDPEEVRHYRKKKSKDIGGC